MSRRAFLDISQLSRLLYHQAAFEHLESIIVYPPGLSPQPNGLSHSHVEDKGNADSASEPEEAAAGTAS